MITLQLVDLEDKAKKLSQFTDMMAYTLPIIKYVPTPVVKLR